MMRGPSAMAARVTSFNAWLRGQYAVRDPDTKSLIIMWLSDAKNKISALVSDGRYQEAAEVSDDVSWQLEFQKGEKLTSWSIRVAFPSYLRLVEESLSSSFTMSDLVRKRVAVILGAAIEALAVRNDIDKDRIVLLKEGLSDLVRATLKEHRPPKAYRPQLLNPHAQFERVVLKKLIKREIEKECDLKLQHVSRRAIGKLLELIQLNNSSLDAVLFAESDKSLKLDVYLDADLAVSASNLEESQILSSLTKEEILSQVYAGHLPLTRPEEELGDYPIPLSSDERQFEDEPLPNEFGKSIKLLSVGMKTDLKNHVLVEGSAIPDKREDARTMLLKELTREYDDGPGKKSLMEALDRDDIKKVTELARMLAENKDKYEPTKVGIDALLDMIYGFQIVTFRIPRILIYTLEACVGPEPYPWIKNKGMADPVISQDLDSSRSRPMETMDEQENEKAKERR